MTAKTESQILQEIIESLTQASGAASQLIHAHQDPRWIPIRESINLAKEGIIQTASMQVEKLMRTMPR